MRLQRPLAVFDLEATGTNPLEDRVVDVCVLVLSPGGSETVFSSLVNPGLPIPPEASAVHKITDAMVKDAPRFADLAPRLLGLFEGADLCGFNALKYDVPLLSAEFGRIGHAWPKDGVAVIDAFVIFARKERRDLSAAYKFFCGKDLAGAHRAEADTRATAEILRAQLKRYPDLPQDAAGLAAWCAQKDANDNRVDAEGKFVWRNCEPAFNFGNKYKGKSLREVARKDPGYITWMIEKGSFAPEVVALCRGALEGRIPSKKA